MQNPQDLKTQIAANIAAEHNADCARVYAQTWSNVNSRNGFKLTGYGFFELRQKHQFWSVALQQELRSVDILRLNRVMQSPWYVDYRGLHFFDSNIAVQLMLYDNDVRFWLEAQSDSNSH